MSEDGQLDQRQMAAGIFQHHGLVHHGELEMGCRIVDRNAAVLGDRHHDQSDERQGQRHAQPDAAATAMNRPQSKAASIRRSSAREKTIMIIAGSASEAIIISRLEPMPPKLVPTSSPASARKKRALPSSAMMAMRSADQENSSPVAKVGTSAAATQVAAKIEIGSGAKQPGGACLPALPPCA